ncbi:MULTISPECIES: pyrimidine dimer DNA glycosylase/endonuclease V [unclassified Agrococcus]|uniref:pyrimidine dimer DNA glycosylase/endonuclease V n=1 Tax=unclassified Agrococcus TaxID=2615065 RepID=UPI00361AA813
MRIWSLHPALLDRRGLVAGWRESLLAQAVLAGATRGYLAHPQLERFRADPEPLGAIGAYLVHLVDEADARGYRFDASRIRMPVRAEGRLTVTTGQLAYEHAHLLAKVSEREPARATALATAAAAPHPLFIETPGPLESWERP